MTKENDLLKLSCDTKNRFSQPFTLHLQIDEGYDYFSFEEVNSPKQQEENTEFQQISDVIRNITKTGDEPYQDKIIRSAKEGYGLSKDKVLKWLDKGQGRFWKVDERIKDHNKKIYNLIDE